MEFNIRKGSTEPVLKLRLIDDGKTDKTLFNDLLENSEITIDLLNTKTNQYKLLGGPCSITNRITKYGQITDEYFIIYQFTSDDTDEIAKYEATVNIQFLDISSNPTTKLIVPIREKLYVNVF